MKPICKTCNSDSVKLDAWAVWDLDSQQWDLETTFDMAFCEPCDGETTLSWVKRKI